jgi:hypothetical protein
MVDVFGRCGVPIPFADIKGQESFIGVSFRGSNEIGEINIQVFNEVLVKVLPEQVG